jgi:hypothetical protein
MLAIGRNGYSTKQEPRGRVRFATNAKYWIFLEKKKKKTKATPEQRIDL